MKKYFSVIVFIVVIFTANQHKVFALQRDFFVQCDKFFGENVNKGLVNYSFVKQNPNELNSLIKQIATAETASLNALQAKAFFINAYNLLVINSVVNAYPTKSVMNITGFFDIKKHKIASKELTLDQIEKDILFVKYKDPRLHFALVCGALSCPAILEHAYYPETLVKELDVKVTNDLNNPEFIMQNATEKNVHLSKIFEWYEKDFGKNRGEVVSFINKYRTEKIDKNFSFRFNEYNWELNDQKNSKTLASPQSNNDFENINLKNATQDATTKNLPTKNTNSKDLFKNNSTNSIIVNDEDDEDDESYTPYAASALLAPKQIELKLFNNLYSQSVNEFRSNYFTTFVQLLYGVNSKVALGVDAKLRAVNNGVANEVGLFNIYNGATKATSRLGLTAFSLKAKFVPFTIPDVSFSVQTALIFPLGDSLNGGQDLAYIDNSGVGFYTNLYFDKKLSSNFSGFLAVSSLVDNVTDSFDKTYWQLPITAIISYYPKQNITLYWLGEFSPVPAELNINYAQMGLGGKFAFSVNSELELSYTTFINKYILEQKGSAKTLNLGLRFMFK